MADWGGTCGITASKFVYCWGWNAWSRWAANGDFLTPQVYGPYKFDHFSISYQNTCGVTEDGKGWCQGANHLGQAGDGTSNYSTLVTNGLVQVQTSHRFVKIEAGIGFTCGLSTDNKTFCWGGNRLGAIGRAFPGVGAVIGGTVFKGAR
jgi:alpha-tubulin suppressor-like RCC1 family protein